MRRSRIVRRIRPASSGDTRSRPMWMNAPSIEGPSATLALVTRPGAPDRGWFITVEGPEGAGKTTQASALAAHLERAGHRRPRHPRAGRHLARRTAPRGPAGAHRGRRRDRSADRRPPVQRGSPPARDRGHPSGPRGRSDGRLRALRRLDAGLPGLWRRGAAGPSSRARVGRHRRPRARPHDPPRPARSRTVWPGSRRTT